MADITKLGSVVTANAQDSTTIDVSHTLLAGSNRIIIAIVSGQDTVPNPNITGCVYDQGGDNVAMTALPEADIDSGTAQVNRMFYLLESGLPSNGAKTVRATASATMDELQIVVIAIQDAKQEAPEADEINTSTSVTISKAITTLTDGAMIISSAAQGRNRTYTHGSGQNEEADFQGGDGGVTMCMTTEVKATAGADTQSHTSSGSVNRHVMVLAAFAPIPELLFLAHGHIYTFE